MTLGPEALICRQCEVATYCTCRNGLLIRVSRPASGIFLDHNVARRMYREQSAIGLNAHDRCLAHPEGMKYAGTPKGWKTVSGKRDKVVAVNRGGPGLPRGLERDVSSTGTARLPPLYKSSGSKDAMIDGSEVVAAKTEQVLNRTMDGKEELGLGP